MGNLISEKLIIDWSNRTVWEMLLPKKKSNSLILSLFLSVFWLIGFIGQICVCDAMIEKLCEYRKQFNRFYFYLIDYSQQRHFSTVEPINSNLGFCAKLQISLVSYLKGIRLWFGSGAFFSSFIFSDEKSANSREREYYHWLGTSGSMATILTIRIEIAIFLCVICNPEKRKDEGKWKKMKSTALLYE